MLVATLIACTIPGVAAATEENDEVLLLAQAPLDATGATGATGVEDSARSDRGDETAGGEQDEYEYEDEYEEDGVFADDIETDFSDVEEFTITGETGGILQSDAAESSVQFDAAELDALGATDISDIARVTPNLEITQSGATSANFFIRGVGLADFSANSASAVAVYQDGVPLNASVLQLAGIFDLQNLAVLRGPQGWGSSRNASAGAILLESRKPTGDYQAEFRSTLGSYWSDVAHSALIQRYNGAIQLPVVDDLLSTRLSFMIQKADPFQTNGCGEGMPPQPRSNSPCGTFLPNQSITVPAGLPSRVGNENRWAARGLFRLQPTAFDMDWLLSVHGSRLDEQSTLGQAMGTRALNPVPGHSLKLGRRTANSQRNTGDPGSAGPTYIEPDQQAEFLSIALPLINAGLPVAEAREAAENQLGEILASGRPLDTQPYRGDYNRVGQTIRDTWGVSLNGTMTVDVAALGPVEFQSITGYEGYRRVRDQDIDFTPLVLFEWAPAEDEAWQFFQELKASGESEEGMLRWEAGGYFLMEDLDASLNQQVSVAQADFLRLYDQKLRSFAFYGGFGWDFLEDFTLDMGVRYNWEQKSFNLFQQSGFVTANPPGEQSTWSAPTGLISLTYRFTEEFSGYWKYTRGWKPGHYNANYNPAAGGIQAPADPETVDSLEAGFNGSWLDARVRLSGSIFYYKYKNYQLFLFENAAGRPPLLQIINANDAEQYGAELELQAVPLQDWEWIPEPFWDLSTTVRFGWLESQFLDFVNEIETVAPGTPTAPARSVVQVVNYRGNRLPSSPEFKVSAAIEYPFDFGRYGTLTPRYDIDWTDDIFFDPSDGRGVPKLTGEQLPPYTVGQKAYAQHHIRLAWTSEDGNLSIAGWVRNLTDVRYKTSAFDASVFADVVLNFVGPPRTGGFDVTLNF